MAFCGGFMVIYWWRYRRAAQRGELDMDATGHTTNGAKPQLPGQTDPAANTPDANIDTGIEDKGRSFTLFIYALLVAYVAVLIRCIYR
jgi:hypothetical protein